MAITTLTLPTNGLTFSTQDDRARQRFTVEVGSGATWTTLATDVAYAGIAYSGSHLSYWDCPATPILTTDQIRVTMKISVDYPETVVHTVVGTTPVLGVSALQANRWVFASNIDYGGVGGVYTSNTVVSGIVYGLEGLKATIRDLAGNTITQLWLHDGVLEAGDKSGTMVTLATGLAGNTLHDVKVDTHTWKVSVNGSAYVAFTPWISPVVWPLGQLEFASFGSTPQGLTNLRYE